jgi:hypothetical protein
LNSPPHDFVANSANGGASAGDASLASRLAPPAAGADPPMTPLPAPISYTFRVFRDWRGMYRWLLTDDVGRRVSASRIGFAAPAGAFSDVEVERRSGHLAAATVRDETGGSS